MLRWIRKLLRSGEHAALDARLQAAYALHQAGELEAARSAYIEILRSQPHHAPTLHLLGEASYAVGDLRQSEAAYRTLLLVDPDNVEAFVNLGSALHALGELEEATAAWTQAIARDPGCAAALTNLAVVSLACARLDEAERWLRAAREADPELAEVRIREGELLVERCRPLEAAQAYREAVRLEPGSTRAHIGLGWALETAGDVDAALQCYEAAVALQPESIDARVSRASLWLSREDFARGWDEFEWRKRAPGNASVHERFSVPEWDGSPLAGRRILCYAEQGLGDQIMYASCLPQIIEAAAHCVVDCDRRLAPLLSRAFPAATIHGGTQSDPGDWIREHQLDLKVSLASLPRHLRRSSAAFPRHAGYLPADPGKVARWRQRLAELGAGRKIGLSWRGGVQRTGRAWRSIPLDELLAVLKIEGVEFVSLQYGDEDAEIARLQEQHGVRIHCFREALEDYDETAALICALDLTLSVCTAVIHLAGALGRPVWIMAPVKADARYGLSGDSMPWYPSARLFRQAHFGDWPGVVERVRDALRSFKGNGV
ncbi:MAG TPA: tetratricopeptide repeat protein [Burkholderiales bacterium]|nr:tetratricopeptide repeat protein [Burkholderiales bacterium]